MTGRIVLALAWLRWRLTVNAAKSGRNRGTLERFSRAVAAAAPILLALLVIPAMLGLTFLGVLGGWAAAARPEASAAVVFIVGISLLAPTGWAFVRPFVMAKQGHPEREELLRLLPIPARLLRHLELVKALLDPLFLVFAPGVLALAAGAALGGRGLVTLVALAGGVGFLALLACLSSLLSLASQLLLRDRQRGELVALVFILAISALGFLPQLFRSDARTLRPPSPPATAEGAARPGHAGPPELEELPLGLRVLPSFQLAQALAGATRGQLAATALPLGTLWALAALAYGLAAPLHRRLLETPASSGTRRTERVEGAGSGSPFVSGPVAAVASVQLSTFLRTVRGKATVALPPVLGLFMALMLTRWNPSGVPGFFASPVWAPVLVALTAVLNLGVLTCNQFAASGTGLVLELLQPVSARAMVRGRALASALLCTASLVVAMVPLLLVVPRAALPTALAIALAGLAAHLAVAPAAAVVSATFPKTVNLSRLGQEDQPHPLAHLAVFALQGIAAVPPAACILVAQRLLGTPWLAPVLTAVWLAVAGILAVAALPLAERALVARRENLALVVAGR
ncbi:MAG TPA: hypothetical protein P5234_03890 [Thermoanaerobaculaceae bacterium]|nr:hypothetical protein [Thermoanaerobaculaceae bacterium]HRS15372.1 hypothetical protein [Thermoanaerobaculaceae bacterium]